MTLKIVSGGQTGADRAGLDAAMDAGLTFGGYSARTEKNVIESDCTVILNMGKLTVGTKLTLECARKHNKPCLVAQLDNVMKSDVARHWITSSNIAVLNVQARVSQNVLDFMQRNWSFYGRFSGQRIPSLTRWKKA